MWDLLKRSFGRSRTIFVNVIGAFAIVFVEMSDTLLNFDWDVVVKHETSMLIAFALQILNVVLRIYTTGPVSFGKAPDDISVSDLPVVIPVEPVEPVEEPKGV